MSYYAAAAAQPSFPQLYAAAQAAQAAYPGARAEPRGAAAAAPAATSTSTAQQAYAAYAAQAAAAAQAAQAAPAAPAAPREEVVGSVAHISVTGCTHSTVGGIVRGNFTANGQNHGRPTYKKDTQVNGLDVQLYYWDDRDGASFCGWWFGPKVGGDQVWAYHPSNTATTPPKTGWKVPYDGPVDSTFLISATAAPAPAAPAAPALQDASQYGYQYSQQYSQEQSIKQKQQEMMQQQMIAQQQKAVALAEMKKKQEEHRRQQEENRVRQQEEMKRRAEEQRKKMEEATALKMEQQKKMAEERKRQFEEQKAAMTLRHFLAQKIRVAKEESELAAAQQELAELIQQELPKCGSSAEKVQVECTQAVESTMKKIENAKEAKRKEEERKEEAAKKNREAQEKATELLKDLGEKVTTTEEAIEQLAAACEQLNPEKEMKLELVTKVANSLDKKAEDATETLKICQDFMKEHGTAMRAGSIRPVGTPATDGDDTPTLMSLMLRMQEAQKKKDTLMKDSTTNKEKLLKKGEAKKKMDVKLLQFKKYDTNKDDVLDKKEIGILAKKEYGITLTEAQLARILKSFIVGGGTGVKKPDFHRLIVQIGVAKEMQKDAARKKKREAHEKEIEALKEELMEKVKETDSKYASVEEKAKEMEAAVKPLTNSKTLTSTEMEPLVAKLEEQAASLKETITGFKSEVAELREGVDSEVLPWFSQQCRPLDGKALSLEPRLNRVNAQLVRSKAEVKLKASQELLALEKTMLAMIRYHQNAKDLSADALFAEIAAKKENVEKKPFLNFFKKCEKEKKEEDAEVKEPSAQDLTRVFEQLADASGAISQERMMGLIRVHKKVIKDTVLSEEKGVKGSTTKRRLEVGEIVEILSQESPADDEVEVMRVQCRAIKDDLEGWVTVSGNEGSKFLADAGAYKVVKETILTDTFELDSAKSKEAGRQLKKEDPRKLKTGELVDVWVWPKKEEESGLIRLKCKCRSDGAVGWVTAVGNAGTIFLEVV